MYEHFLHYLWGVQRFDSGNLKTQQGDAVVVLDPGLRNKHAGPDFLNASLKIGDLIWHGHVELHVHARDWYTHGHHKDAAYNNVILHVVWNTSQATKTSLPVLVLQDRTLPQLPQHYGHRKQPVYGPYTGAWAHWYPAARQAMLDKALWQHLKHRADQAYTLWQANKGNTAATAYQLLAQCFGFSVNSSAWLDLSLCTPLNIIQQHSGSLLHLEALLFGQAGLLPSRSSAVDAYCSKLINLYTHLKRRHGLKTYLTPAQWRFFRLRPANFPTIRIAQFAQLLHQHIAIFASLPDIPHNQLAKQLAVRQSTYWRQHYQFGQASKRPIPGLGRTSLHTLLVNTAPFRLLNHGSRPSQKAYDMRQTIAFLQGLPPEHNSVTRHWHKMGFRNKHAADSQALLALSKQTHPTQQALPRHRLQAFRRLA